MRRITVNERFGVEIPSEFCNKYSAFRYHDKRIKVCKDCKKKYYDQTVSNKSKGCLDCQILSLKTEEERKGGKQESEALLDVLRTKECVYCHNKYAC